MLLPIEKGEWEIDRSHTTIAFVARHLGFTKVRGTYTDYDAKIIAGDTLQDSSVNINVRLLSVNTGNEDRDSHLRRQDFFGASQDPTMKFSSTEIKQDGKDYKLTGDLTINGKTLPVDFKLSFDGVGQDPMGNTKAGFEAKAEVNRTDFGITWNVPVGDGLLVSEKIKIQVDTQIQPM